MLQAGFKESLSNQTSPIPPPIPQFDDSQHGHLTHGIQSGVRLELAQRLSGGCVQCPVDRSGFVSLSIWVHLHFVVGFRPGGHIGRFFAFFRIHFDDCRILRNQYPGQKPDFKENGDCTHYPQQTEQQRNSPSYLQVRVPESRAVDQNNRSERNCNPLSAEFTHLWQSHKCNSDSVLRLLRIVEIYLDLRLTQTEPQLHRSVSSSPFFGVT